MIASDVTSHAAKAFMNDAAQVLWTDAVLLPYLAQAVLELGQTFRLYEIPLQLKVGVTITVNIGDLSLAQLPVDFIEPLYMQERTFGSSDDWSDHITEVGDVDPNDDTSETVEEWVFRNNQIYINPPTTKREVRLFYVGDLTAVTVAGSTVDLDDSKAYLAARTAQLATKYGGNNPTKAAELQPDVDDAKETLVGALVKNTQGSGSARHKGYKGRH